MEWVLFMSLYNAILAISSCKETFVGGEEWALGSAGVAFAPSTSLPWSMMGKQLGIKCGYVVLDLLC